MNGTDGRGHPAGSTARTLAQAKVNLFLRVLAREASGYHQLETLFCRLELGDDVTIRTDVRGRSLDCTGDVIPPAGLGPTERNLAWRAAVAYADATGWPNEWAIEIVKTVPVGGGLGGGSAGAYPMLNARSAPLPSTSEVIAAPQARCSGFCTDPAALRVGTRGRACLRRPSVTVASVRRFDAGRARRCGQQRRSRSRGASRHDVGAWRLATSGIRAAPRRISARSRNCSPPVGASDPDHAVWGLGATGRKTFCPTCARPHRESLHAHRKPCCCSGSVGLLSDTRQCPRQR
jgi:hypothetical protein